MKNGPKNSTINTENNFGRDHEKTLSNIEAVVT